MASGVDSCFVEAGILFSYHIEILVRVDSILLEFKRMFSFLVFLLCRGKWVHFHFLSVSEEFPIGERKRFRE